jgi:O-antigen ligase
MESLNFMGKISQKLDGLVLICLVTFVIFSMFSISITQISFTLGTVAWLTKVHLTQTWKKVDLTALGVPILLFCLASILAVITATDWEISLKPLKKILQLIIFFWVVNSVKDEKQRNLLIMLLIIAGCIAALNGFWQAWNTTVSTYDRVSGTMSIYMTFAGILMLVGLMALSKYLFEENRSFSVLVATALIAFCLLLTLTRQAWLGFFVGTFTLVYFWNKKYLLAIPMAIISLLLFAPEIVKDRLFTLVDLKDWTFQVRIFLWQGGWEIFKDHPLTGCGFKCVDIIHSQYPDPSGYISHYRGMHNNIVQLLVDTGIIGLGTWLSIWVTYFIAMHKKWTQPHDESARYLVMGSTAALLGFLAGGLFETNFYDSEVVMLLYFIMGISLAQTNKIARE